MGLIAFNLRPLYRPRPCYPFGHIFKAVVNYRSVGAHELIYLQSLRLADSPPKTIQAGEH